MNISQLKEWLWSAKVLTTMVWILFPLGYIAIILFLEFYGKGGVTIVNVNGPFIRYEEIFLAMNYPLLDSPEPRILGLYNIYIPPIPFILVLLVFSIYPAIYPTEKFFKKRESANAVVEYAYIRKILYAFLIALVFAIIMLYFTRSTVAEQRSSMIYLTNQRDNLTNQRDNLTNQRDNLTEQSKILLERGMSATELHKQLATLKIQISNSSKQLSTLNSQFEISENQYHYHWSVNHAIFLTAFMFPIVLITILLKLLLEHARKQFPFYYAKTCINVINETKNDTDKAGYLSQGLNWYNKFVKRVTSGSIDTEVVYSKIISHSQLSNNILLDTIMDSFHNGDELKPMRHMMGLLSCWKEGGGILVKQSLRAKVKESSDLFIPIVGVIVTILSSFFFARPGS